MRRRLTVALALLGLGACQPVIPADDPDALADRWGPALAEVMADGTLTCAEHAARNQYNVCPDAPPGPGADANGVTWSPDLLLGVWPNLLHWPLGCYRGTSADLGLSSYQCCYDGGVLVDEGPQAGSFDFVFPYLSPLTALWHAFLDILPAWQCGGSP